MESAAYSALIDENSGDLHDWQNPDNGATNSHMVLRTFLNEDGKICRVLNTVAITIKPAKNSKPFVKLMMAIGW